MAVGYPIWLLGKHEVSCLVTGIIVGSDGSVTYAASTSLTGLWTNLQLRNQRAMVEVSAANATELNNVPLANDWSLELTELMRYPRTAAAETDGSVLIAATQGYDFIQITFKSGEGKTWTGNFSWAEVAPSYADKGPRTVTITLRQATVAGAPAVTRA